MPLKAGEALSQVRDAALEVGTNTVSAAGELRTGLGYLAELARDTSETIPQLQQQARCLVEEHAAMGAARLDCW